MGESDKFSSKLTDILHSNKRIITQSSEPTIKDVCERIDKGRINPQADFQRKYVWKNDVKIKSRLIESVFLDVPIPTIYTAEEDDGSEVVIDGQQRLQTFLDFLRNKFRLSGLSVLPELNHKSFKSLGEIDPSLQEKIEDYPLRIFKILRDSDNQSVRFDIFERLNRGSVKLNDQELRNCIYRGTFNNFLKSKDASQDKDFQLLLGSKEHSRFQDVELALRFFALYERRENYKSPMKHFISNFMKDNKDIENDKIDNYKMIFKNSVHLVKSVFGKEAFYLYTLDNKTKYGQRENVINKGLFDILLTGFTKYNQNQVMPYKDALKEEIFYLMTNHDDFKKTITGAGTDSTKKLETKMNIWFDSLKKIIGFPKIESRCFSWELKNLLWETNPVCAICGQEIELLQDSEIDHIEFYWRGGKTIPENARLVHRYCNRARRQEDFKDFDENNFNETIDDIENNIRTMLHNNLSANETDYWEKYIPDNIKEKVRERVNIEIGRHPFKEKELVSYENRLSFCDIRDYFRIIKSNWIIFEDIFKSKTETEKHFDNLANYRNSIKHARTITSIERKTGEASMEWITKVLEYLEES